MSKSVITYLVDFFVVLLVIIFISIIALTFISRSNLGWGIKALLVRSGSMEPAIHTGDLIVIQKQASYVPKDIITFSDSHGKKVTHRIFSQSDKKSGDYFITKGDANQVVDADVVKPSQIDGRVIVHLPFFGRLVIFAKSTPGLILLILIPSILIIFEEASLVLKHAK